MRTTGRNPVLIIPAKGMTKQTAIDKLLKTWEENDRKRQDKSKFKTADFYWIKALTRNNYQQQLNNGKLSRWKNALTKYYGKAYIPKQILAEIKSFFKEEFNCRFEIKPISFMTLSLASTSGNSRISEPWE